ncbi:hypothetical protein JZU68_08125, partial [bacterium]|nr:hypothetical protein [bacterium]
MTNFTKTYNSRDYSNAFLFGLFATHTYIMTPASTFEKFSLQFLIRIVFGIIVLMVSFSAVAHLARTTALQMESVKRSGIFIDTFNFRMLYDVYTDNM